MAPDLLNIIGIIIIIIGIAGIFTGQVMAGSRGLRPNYYKRDENPALFYFFICAYFAIGIIVLFKV